MDIITRIKSKGMTVAATARMSGISRETLYALRRPDYRPAVQTVVAVANVLGCEPGDIRPELRPAA